MSLSISLTAIIVGIVCMGAQLYYQFRKKDARKAAVSSLCWYICFGLYMGFAASPWWIRTWGIAASLLGLAVNVLALRKMR